MKPDFKGADSMTSGELYQSLHNLLSYKTGKLTETDPFKSPVALQHHGRMVAIMVSPAEYNLLREVYEADQTRNQLSLGI